MSQLLRNISAFLSCWALAGLFAAPAAAKGCAKPANRAFRMFNALAYANQPDMARFGLEPIHIVDRGIWREGAPRTSAPDPALVRQTLDALPDDDAPVVLDFEDYDFGGGPVKAEAALSGLRRLLRSFKAAAPDREIGLYGYLPQRDYWRAIAKPGSAEYGAWQAENNHSRRLSASVDILFPSIYTFYDDQAGWKKYAEAQICEARRMSDKPVYVFLWPEVHNRGYGSDRPLSADYWRLQLETARRLADGVVLWGGWDIRANKPRQFDPSAGWWRETVNFAREK